MKLHLHSSTHAIRAIRDAPIDDDDASISRPCVRSRAPSLFDDDESERCLSDAPHRNETETKVDIDDDARDVLIGTR